MNILPLASVMLLDPSPSCFSNQQHMVKHLWGGGEDGGGKNNRSKFKVPLFDERVDLQNQG